MKSLLIRFWRDEKTTAHGLLAAAAIIALAIAGMQLARGEEAKLPPGTKWTAAALVRVGDKIYPMEYGHEPFDSEKECEDFRANDEHYKSANVKLEERIRTLGVDDVGFKYFCLPITPRGQDI